MQKTIEIPMDKFVFGNLITRADRIFVHVNKACFVSARLCLLNNWFNLNGGTNAGIARVIYLILFITSDDKTINHKSHELITWGSAITLSL